MLAIACGKSNIVVLDLDCYPGEPDGVEAFFDLEEKHGRIARAPRIKTPSGGLHLYFKQPADTPLTNSTGDLPASIDVRGVGGYVVAPSAMLPDGRRYEPVPGTPRISEALANGGLPTPDDWLLKLLRPAPRWRESLAPRYSYDDSGGEERAFVGEALKFISPDLRDNWLRCGMALHESGHSWARNEWDAWARSSSKYDARDQEQTWRGFGRSSGARVTIGSIIEEARRNGFTGHKFPFVDSAPSPETRVKDSEAYNPPSEAATKSSNLDGVYFDGDAPPAPVPMLIERLVPLGGTTFLAGQSGAGKTFTALDPVLSLATHGAFFGYASTERVAVIYVAAEGAATIATRLDAAKKAHGVDDKLPVAVVKKVPDFGDNRERAEFIQKLKLIAERLKADFGLRVGAVIVDTIISTFNIKDENSAGELSQVCKAVAELGASIGAATIPLAHYGKSQETGIRGSSATRGFGDSVLAVLADRDETSGKCSNRRLIHSKSRVGEEGPIARFELRDVTLTDESGNEFRAGYVEVGESLEGTDAAQETVPKSKRSLSAAGKAFLEALTEAVAGGGKKCRPLTDMPEVVAVDIESVRGIFYPRWPADGDQKRKINTRRPRFNAGFGETTRRRVVSTLEVDGVQLVWVVRESE